MDAVIIIIISAGVPLVFSLLGNCLFIFICKRYDGQNK